MPDEARSPSCVSYPRTQNHYVWKIASIEQACCLVGLRLTSVKFVSYNNWTLSPVCLPSIYVTSLHMTKSPPSFCILEPSAAWERGYKTSEVLFPSPPSHSISKVYIVRLNPFYTGVGACLFTWNENAKVLTRGPFEFRIIDEPKKAPECFSSFQSDWQNMLESVLQSRKEERRQAARTKCVIL